MRLTMRYIGKYMVLAMVVIGAVFPLIFIIRKNMSPPKTRGPKTMNYTIFDTSNYVNEEGKLYIPSDKILVSMTHGELEELYNRYQESLQVVCPRMLHIGEDFDGGYHICETMVPKHSCLAYSFGNHNDYTFDGGLAAIYGCEVHAFDPADGQEDHKHSDKVTFHKLGISGQDEITQDNMVLKTVDSVRQMLKHDQRSLDILKIDTENAEWGAFAQMLKSRTLQRADVKLIIVEFHSAFMTRNKAFYLSALDTLRALDDIGYKRYFFRNWIHCPIKDIVTNIQRVGCHEVHFMKV